MRSPFRLCLLIVSGGLVARCDGYTLERRRLFKSAFALATMTTSVPQSQAAPGSYCASGVGEGCAALSEGNDFIRSLQEKSAANRERNEKVRE